MDEQKNDGELLRAFCEQNCEHSFLEVVRRYERLIYGICLRNLENNHAMAQDALQSVIMTLARKAGTIKHRASVAGWLVKAACFATRTLWRSHQRYEQMKVRLHEHVHGHGAPAASTPRTTWDDARPVLDEALAMLPEHLRDVLAMHYFADMSMSEIADQLGQSPDTVRARRRRACEKLRVILRKKHVAVSLAVLMNGLQAEACPQTPGAVDLAQAALAGGEQDAALEAVVQSVMRRLNQAAWRYWMACAMPAFGLAAVCGVLLFNLAAPRTWRLDQGAAGIAAPSGLPGSLPAHHAAMPVQPGDALMTGRVLLTGANRHAVIRWDRAVHIAPREDTQLFLDAPEKGLFLHRGALRVWTDAPVVLHTDHVRIKAAPATEFILMRTDDQPGFSRIDVVRGQVQCSPILDAGRQERLTANQALTAGNETGVHRMPSRGREFSPRFGGVFYRDCAAWYDRGDFILATCTFQTNRVLLDPDPRQLRSMLHHDTTLSTTNNALRVQASRKQWHYALLPCDLDRYDALQWNLSLYTTPVAVGQTTFVLGPANPDDRTVLRPSPHLVPTIPRQNHTLALRTRTLLHYRYRLLPCGCMPDGQRIFEAETLLKGQPPVRGWSLGLCSHIGVRFYQLTLRIVDFRLSTLELKAPRP